MSGLATLAPNATDAEFDKLIDRSKPLGSGTTRNVFEMRGDPTLVIKEMKEPFPIANVTEWIIWGAVRKMADDIMGNTPNAETQNLFAKCHNISQSGKYLIMERLSPLKVTDTIVRSAFPDWINDSKRDAYGWSADGTMKVMDYAMIDFYEVLNPKNRTSPF
ncbi:hypothetical protein [uncultured Agrobacterium sp.]|uniref:hypothetical protein n=1 Tax=uncultured Agrobacterium sp. TaxID=157277 RepID=UPI0025FAF386|nr:hypothetical protein [uncultured Agrobacterium sp.]